MLRSAVAAADMCVHAGAHARNHGKRRAFTRETASLRKPTVLSRDGLRDGPQEKGNHPSPFSSAVGSRGDVPNVTLCDKAWRKTLRGMWTVEIHIHLTQYLNVILQCCTPECAAMCLVSQNRECSMLSFSFAQREKKVIRIQLAQRINIWILAIDIRVESNEPSTQSAFL